MKTTTTTAHIDGADYDLIADDDLPDAVVDAVQGAPRGSYQRSLLVNGERWSGSSLRGKANEYGARYAESRANLVERINGRLPDGWSASTQLVLGGSPRRHRRELVLFAPGGRAHVW